MVSYIYIYIFNCTLGVHESQLDSEPLSLMIDSAFFMPPLWQQCPQHYLCEIENCPVRTFDRFILPAIELAKLPMNESSRKGD
jgi:hypothetical protein